MNLGCFPNLLSHFLQVCEWSELNVDGLVCPVDEKLCPSGTLAQSIFQAGGPSFVPPTDPVAFEGSCKIQSTRAGTELRRATQKVLQVFFIYLFIFIYLFYFIFILYFFLPTNFLTPYFAFSYIFFYASGSSPNRSLFLLFLLVLIPLRFKTS